MASISGLSVKVSSSVAGFRAGMSRAQESAQDLSLSLRRLNAATNTAERGLDSAGRSALTTAGSFGLLSAASSILTTRIFGLSAGLWLALIPALAALSTALAPLIAGLGGFIAIAGAIGGIGLVGTIGAIATHTETFKEEAKETVELLKDAFGPALDTFASGLLFVIEAFQNIIPELVPAQSVVEQLVGNFTQLGVALVNALPAFVNLATTLAQDFLPGFVTFAQRILPDVPGMIRSLASAFRRILPILFGFGRWFRRIAPDLMAFGMTVLQGVANGLGVVGDAIANVLSIGADSGSLGEFFRRLIVDAATWLESTGLPMIADLAGGILDKLSTFFNQGGSGELANMVSSMMGGIATALGSVKDKDIQRVTNQLETILAGVLGGLATAIESDQAGALGTQIARLAGSVIGVVFDKLIQVAQSDTFAQGIADLSTAIAAGLAKGITIATANALSEVSLTDVALSAASFGTGGVPTSAVSGAVSSQAPSPRETRQQINVNVTGDTGVIKDVAVDAAGERITQEERRTRRNSGSSPTP